jgi:hypothetical protein
LFFNLFLLIVHLRKAFQERENLESRHTKVNHHRKYWMKHRNRPQPESQINKKLKYWGWHSISSTGNEIVPQFCEHRLRDFFRTL